MSGLGPLRTQNGQNPVRFMSLQDLIVVRTCKLFTGAASLLTIAASPFDSVVVVVRGLTRFRPPNPFRPGGLNLFAGLAAIAIGSSGDAVVLDGDEDPGRRLAPGRPRNLPRPKYKNCQI